MKVRYLIWFSHQRVTPSFHTLDWIGSIKTCHDVFFCGVFKTSEMKQRNIARQGFSYFYGDYDWHDKAQWARVETFITSTDLDWDTWTRSFHPRPPGFQNSRHRCPLGSSSPPLLTPRSSPCCSPSPLLRWRASPPPSPPGRWGSRKSP